MHFQIFALVAAIYLMLSYPAAKAVDLLERRLDKQNIGRPARNRESPSSLVGAG
jgi:hypothetical protein